MAEQPKSPLPRDPRFWDRLSERVRADARAPLAEYRKIEESWAGVVARSAPWLVASAAAAFFAVWLALPASRTVSTPGWLERELTPKEVAGSLLGGPRPPSLSALLPEFPPASIEPDGSRPDAKENRERP